MNVQDGTLVIGTLNGDRSAFAELYDRRARLVRAVCYDETRDTHAAAELTQEVFLRAYRDLRRLHVPDKFAIWLSASPGKSAANGDENGVGKNGPWPGFPTDLLSLLNGWIPRMNV